MSLVAVLGSAAAICACSVAVGQALWRVAGFRGWSWLAGPAGLAALIAVESAVVPLPGAGVTGAVALLLLTVAAIAIAWRDLVRPELAEGTLLLALGLAVASLPFIATGRVGILGVTDNADLSAHLMLADAAASGHHPVGIDPGWYVNYPTGPHALVAALHRGIGVPLDAAFTGLLLATLALAALTAMSVLRRAGRSRRIVGALVAGVPYLGAAYTVQSSFKETLLGLLAVAWTLALAEVLPALRARQRAILPLAFLAAGAYADYSFVGLVWLGAAAVAVLAAELLRAGRLPRPAISPRSAIAAGLFAAILAVAALPQLDRAKALVGAVEVTAGGATTGGNVRAELPAYEIFGAWPSSDLRSFGAGMTPLRVLALFAGCAAVWAAWWWWRRRRPALPAAAFALLVVYVVARARTTPYYTGKALAIASFTMGLMIVGAVVSALPPIRRLRREGALRAAAALAGIAFVALAGWSSALALRGARVAPSEHVRELASLRPLLRGSPTLYMGQNDYIGPLLHGVPVAFPYVFLGNSQVDFDVRPEKHWTIPSPFDFDDVAPASLDHFRFVLAPRTPYASAPPPNWRLARTTRSYLVWERHGPTPPHAVLAEGHAPGALLDCGVPSSAALARRRGEAAVRPPPVVVDGRALTQPAGGRLPVWQFHFRVVRAGKDAVAHVSLPAGRWDLSMQYVSPFPLEATANGVQLHAPPSLEGPGAFWWIGTLTSNGGSAQIRIRPESAPPLAAFHPVLLGALALTRAGARERMVPLHDACGRYVDWYRTA